MGELLECFVRFTRAVPCFRPPPPDCIGPRPLHKAEAKLKADLSKRETRNTDKAKRAQLIAADEAKVEKLRVALELESAQNQLGS